MHSAYSFGDGASSPSELASAAAALGYEACALTDHDNLCGAMEFAHACRDLGVRPITGCELTIEPPPLREATKERLPYCHLTVLVEQPRGYQNLCRLLSTAHLKTRERRDRRQSQPTLTIEQLAAHSDGLICLTGCARAGLIAGLIACDRGPEAARALAQLRSIFGPEHLFVELQRPFWRHDRARNMRLAALADRFGLRCVATGNVHCHDRSRVRLQDALVAVGANLALDACEPLRRGNSSAALAGPAAMAKRFADHPAAVFEGAELARRLRFDLTTDLGYSYPGAEDPDADANLAAICADRFAARYAGLSHRSEALARLEEELRIIRLLRLSGFFLLHHDLLELARQVASEVRGSDAARAVLPPGRGRGSSVSSIVCYLTGLSHVDPVKAGLFLGRFLNEEIAGMPDIDLDFPRDVRELLIPRIHQRYGTERSALVAAFPTYKPRGAIRFLGKALGLPAAEIERVAKNADMYMAGITPGYLPRVSGNGGAPGLVAEPPQSDSIEATRAIFVDHIVEVLGEDRAAAPRWRALVELAAEVQGLPRHVSQHSGGMVLSTRPLIELCPVQPTAMVGRQTVQWDKDSCADAGFLKIDLLGLGMLSAVERCLTEIARARNQIVDLSRIPLDDKAVYGAIQRAETTGVFQIESRAQMQMLPRSRPANLEDLTVQVAIVRPGPIQGGAVHPYLERRKRLRENPSYKVPYEHPSLEPILADTLGAIVFQDQVIQVAMALAGFSAGEAEGLRRAMSRKRSEQALASHRERFISGALERGVELEVAERVFGQIQGFSGFGFPKSHAAAFGLLAYQSTWLRVYYGPEFLCGLLNEQPMGFYPPDALIHEAQRRGIEVRGPDLNASALLCLTEPTGSKGGLAIRIGLGYVKGLRTEEAEMIAAERARGGRFEDSGDLAARTGISRGGLRKLAWAGAFGDRKDGDRAGGARRRESLWEAGTTAQARSGPAGTQLPLPIAGLAPPTLKPLEDWERVIADYETTGVSIETHPVQLLRPSLPANTLTSRQLETCVGAGPVTTAGMVVARQRPGTANGVVFILLEDEHGVINLILPSAVFERHRTTVRSAAFLRVEGILQRRDGTTNVLVNDLGEIARPADPNQAEARVHQLPEEGAHSESTTTLPGLAMVLPAIHSFGRRR